MLKLFKEFPRTWSILIAASIIFQVLWGAFSPVYANIARAYTSPDEAQAQTSPTTNNSATTQTNPLLLPATTLAQASTDTADTNTDQADPGDNNATTIVADAATAAAATLANLNLAPASAAITTTGQNPGNGNGKAKDKDDANEAYGKLPLSFEANQGQADSKVKFVARGSGYSLYLTQDELVLALKKPTDKGKEQCLETVGNGKAKGNGNSKSTKKLKPVKGQPCDVGPTRGLLGKSDEGVAFRMSLVGANPSPLTSGEKEVSGKTNYLRGTDPTKWQTNLSSYEQVLYKGVYNGIDLRYSGQQGSLEYTFEVAAGADPGLITLKFAGHDKVEIGSKGELILHSGKNQLLHQAPIIYQEDSSTGIRQIIKGNYVSRGANEVGFELKGSYDKTKPLIIDPVLAYSTYLGGSGDEYGQAIALDSSGNAYITGYTWGTDFPTTSGPIQPSNHGNSDVLVAKISANGNELLYSTYLGGSQYEDNEGSGIAVDSQGFAYVAGSTYSDDFPVTSGAYQTVHQSGMDTFVAKLNQSGSALVYATFVGGNAGEDYSEAIALDSANNVYVTGSTSSSDFPTTSGAYKTTYGGGNRDGFAYKLNSSGTALVYSTFLGGSGEDRGQSIALDSSGAAYVAGFTTSTNYPYHQWSVSDYGRRG